MAPCVFFFMRPLFMDFLPRADCRIFPVVSTETEALQSGHRCGNEKCTEFVPSKRWPTEMCTIDPGIQGSRDFRDRAARFFVLQRFRVRLLRHDGFECRALCFHSDKEAPGSYSFPSLDLFS